MKRMNPSKRMDRNERLGAALRQGDPVSQESGLSPAETQAMRRAVLAAVPETGRRSLRLVPVFAAGAVAVLSLVVALRLVRQPAPAPVPPAVSAQAPAVSVPPVAQPPLAVAIAVAPPPVHAVRRRSPERRIRMAAAAAVRSSEPAVRPDAAAPMRQVQFSAPGGTRIIWLLHETAP